MTIAISLKVGDGVVLGADSASSIVSDRGVENVYFNGEKIFNLRKGLPIGAATYGLGGIALRSITSLARDLRERFTNVDHEWHLNAATYTMEEVALRLRTFFYEEHYVPAVRDMIAQLQEERARLAKDNGEPEPDAPIYPGMGFIIAGFSANRPKPEVWEVQIDTAGNCRVPGLVWNEESAGVVTYRGQPEALNRLLFGYADKTVRKMIDLGVPEQEAVDFLVDFARLAHPAMPIQDAIDLVDFLANTTCGYMRFMPGHPTVAGPIDLAAITKHEQFKWVRRKHYYPIDRNPPLHS
jgi:hypothetical protein